MRSSLQSFVWFFHIGELAFVIVVKGVRLGSRLRRGAICASHMAKAGLQYNACLVWKMEHTSKFPGAIGVTLMLLGLVKEQMGKI